MSLVAGREFRISRDEWGVLGVGGIRSAGALWPEVWIKNKSSVTTTLQSAGYVGRSSTVATGYPQATHSAYSGYSGYSNHLSIVHTIGIYSASTSYTDGIFIIDLADANSLNGFGLLIITPNYPPSPFTFVSPLLSSLFTQLLRFSSARYSTVRYHPSTSLLGEVLYRPT